MDDIDYEILTALKSEKSISRIAEKLYISQSALSKRIQKIEKELDATLICRTSKGYLLTAIGEGVQTYIENISDQIKKMHEYIDTNRSEVSGSLIAGISQNYSCYALPKVLEQFIAEYPLVSVTIRTGKSSHMYSLLQNSSVDFAIVRGEYKWEEGKIFLSSEPLCIVTGTPDTPLDPKHYIGRYTDSTLLDEINDWAIEQSFSLNESNLRIDNIDTILEMIKSHCGWSILPQICLTNADVHYKPVFFRNGHPLVRNTYLLYRNEGFVLPQVRAFIECAYHAVHPLI